MTMVLFILLCQNSRIIFLRQCACQSSFWENMGEKLENWSGCEAEIAFNRKTVKPDSSSSSNLNLDRCYSNLFINWIKFIYQIEFIYQIKSMNLIKNWIWASCKSKIAFRKTVKPDSNLSLHCYFHRNLYKLLIVYTY